MKFLAYALATGTVFLGKIEAETAEDAMEQAREKAEQVSLTLCHHCSGKVDMDDLDTDKVTVEEA